MSCAGSTEQKPQTKPTATFSPADATATWEAFKPERDRIAAEVLEKQIVQATTVAATTIAGELTPATGPRFDPTRTPVLSSPPPRAIATGPVNRIAFSDGRGSVLTVNPDGSGLAVIAGGSTIGGEIRYTFPVWSPDGGSLVFSSFVIVANSVSQSALHRANADGKGTDRHACNR